MCIGLPMRVIEGDDLSALCERMGRVERISMMLVGEQPSGAYLLTHLGTAMRVIEADEARLIDEALAGLAEAAAGEAFEARFADLLGREPTLPAHLR